MSSAELKSLLADCAPDMLLAVDPTDLEIRAANLVALEQLGYKESELIGRSILSVDCGLADVMFWEELRNGGKASCEGMEGIVQRADGTLLAVTKSVHERHGWLVLCMRDVSAAKHRNNEVAQLTARLRATLDATFDGILVLATDGSIVNMNARFAEMWQLPDALILARDDTQLFAFMAAQAQDAVAYRERLEEIHPYDEADSFDVLELSGERVFERKSRPAMQGKQITGRVYCFTDASARHAAERELVAARDEAQAASRAKSEFLTLVSHEVRTPLNGVLGMAELLQSTGLGSEQKHYLAAIRSSGETLLGMISDILDYTNLDCGRVQLDQSIFEPRDVVEELREKFTARATEKRLSFRVEIAPEVPAAVCGDRRRFTQILTKLLDNAIKFTDRGSVEFCLKVAERADKRVHIECQVRDTGIGVAGDRLPKLFQPFVTADNSLTRRHTGTGMGLALCRLLCAHMGGDIAVDSAAGAGSTFHCRLPFDLPDPATTRVSGAVSNTVPVAGASRPALIVEPDTARRELIVAALASIGGFQVRVAADALECLEISSQDPQSLIFIASSMHGLDGNGTARALRAAGCRAHIICTGDDAEGAHAAAVTAGADDFLAVPLTGRAVRCAVSRWQNCDSAACA
ncbi:MAG: PAS domain-containing protein [Rhodocyclaceae bacterium]|nr:PAS domain-containing protein [Rhodocyclaceae bacterium]MBX3669525.1 PAS domain-containing protein [Rhodocyclaceae bacterium]